MNYPHIFTALLIALTITGCGKHKEREMDVEQKMTEIHDNQHLEDKEAADYFLTIPVFEPSKLANEEIITGADNHLIVRTYLINGVKLRDVFDFYKDELSQSDWKIDEGNTETEPHYTLYASDGKRNVKIGMDGKDYEEAKYYITMTVRKGGIRE